MQNELATVLRSAELNRNRVIEIDREVKTLNEEYLSLGDIAPGTPGFQRACKIADQWGRLAEERDWLTMTPQQRAALIQKAAAG